MALILVVDDEPDIVELISRILARAGHCVVTAGTAEAALQAVGGRAIDLAVIDVRLPRADGIGLAHTLRRRPRGAPVCVACTGYFRESTLVPLGFDGFVRKPIDAVKFVDYINALLAARPGPRPEPACLPAI